MQIFTFIGRLAEWSNVLVLKTSVQQCTVGSNPTSSAIRSQVYTQLGLEGGIVSPITLNKRMSMKVNRWDKIETYKVVKQLKEDHMIDARTYAMMLTALGISENSKRTILYEGDQELDITLAWL